MLHPHSILKKTKFRELRGRGTEEFRHRDLVGMTQGTRGHHAILSTATGQGEEVDGHLDEIRLRLTIFMMFSDVFYD